LNSKSSEKNKKPDSGDYAIPEIHRQILKNDRIYLELIGGGDKGKIDGLYDDELKKVMKQMGNNISFIRTKYAYALRYENDAEKADLLLKAFDKAALKHPYTIEVEGERELLELAALPQII